MCIRGKVGRLKDGKSRNVGDRVCAEFGKMSEALPSVHSPISKTQEVAKIATET
jgi:hypothetical protein